ncbi:MAG: Rho termination factor N-terminal domain-containing protein [Thermoleophilales bacterium]|nr:Rho termination factor N-terminal domain-containing protein [Thermoleophilales bacterium]
MVEIVRKSVAVGIAGVTAVVVAAWRQIQRDNTLATDSTPSTAPARPVDLPSFEKEPSQSATTQTRSPEALFTPSVNDKSTKAELYEVATELGIEGRSKMNKSQLIEAIRTAS